MNELGTITTLAKEKLTRVHRTPLLETRHEIEDVFDDIHKIRD